MAILPARSGFVESITFLRSSLVKPGPARITSAPSWAVWSMAAATSRKNPERVSSPLPLPLPCRISAAICTPNWRSTPMLASPSSIKAMTTLGL